MTMYSAVPLLIVISSCTYLTLHLLLPPTGIQKLSAKQIEGSLAAILVETKTFMLHHPAKGMLCRPINLLKISAHWVYSRIIIDRLVDSDVLRTIASGGELLSSRPIKFAVDRSFKDDLVDETMVEIIYYEKPLQLDYWIFTDSDGTKRALLPFETVLNESYTYPKDIESFLQDWEYSQFIECANVLTRPDNTSRRIPLSFVTQFAALRDFIKKNDNAHLVACGGTLLGWYRECSIVPHTTDVDFLIRSEEYSPKIQASLKAKQSPFNLFRIYGLTNDSYELSITVKKVKKPRVNIDLFSFYTARNESWMGGLAWKTRQKYKWSYPRTTEYCTGDLIGHLIYVPCNIEEFLEADYGEWAKDRPSNKYSWYKSASNVSPNGKFSEAEIKQMKPR